jgi:hypothetical protein
MNAQQQPGQKTQDDKYSNQSTPKQDYQNTSDTQKSSGGIAKKTAPQDEAYDSDFDAEEDDVGTYDEDPTEISHPLNGIDLINYKEHRL